jgi:hypothetical protein
MTTKSYRGAKHRKKQNQQEQQEQQEEYDTDEQHEHESQATTADDGTQMQTDANAVHGRGTSDKSKDTRSEGES